MTYTLVLQPEALEELKQGKLWYNQRLAGLGNEFISEVNQVLSTLAASPMLGTEIYRDLRRRNLRRFPYSVIYQVTDDRIDVVAIFHASQDPEKWKARA
ncbi:MAG: type II toxin-antitoxin system RelE/ParE family toxin [Verrucomicrobiota bacterium]